MRRSKVKKVSAMRAEEFFDKRARRADPAKASLLVGLAHEVELGKALEDLLARIPGVAIRRH